MLEVSEDYPSSFMKASSAGKNIRVNLNFHVSTFRYSLRRIYINTMKTTFDFNFILVIMQGKLFQRCAHLLYCSVLSLGGNVNTRWMSQPDMGSIFHIKNQWNILVKENYYVNYQNSMLSFSSDTKRTLMHLFLLTNSAHRELV